MLVGTEIFKPGYPDRHTSYVGLSSCFFVRAGEGKPSQERLAWLCRIKSKFGRWSRHLSCPFRHGARHGGMPQVDDGICLHHTADPGGAVEQCKAWRERSVLGRGDRGDKG